jgi:hypothetical protein
VGQRAVDEVGEHGLGDRVASVGDVRVDGGLGVVGEKRVIPPDRNSASWWLRSRTRRTISLAVTGFLVLVNAV